VKKPVSKFAFQVHNLQRYNAVFTAEFLGRLASTPDLRNYFNETMNQVDVVGLCTLESS
jgi:hypothetical protein